VIINLISIILLLLLLLYNFFIFLIEKIIKLKRYYLVTINLKVLISAIFKDNLALILLMINYLKDYNIKEFKDIIVKFLMKMIRLKNYDLYFKFKRYK